MSEDVIANAEDETSSAQEWMPKPGIEPGTFRSSV